MIITMIAFFRTTNPSWFCQMTYHYERSLVSDDDVRYDMTNDLEEISRLGAS